MIHQLEGCNSKNTFQLIHCTKARPLTIAHNSTARLMSVSSTDTDTHVHISIHTSTHIYRIKISKNSNTLKEKGSH